MTFQSCTKARFNPWTVPVFSNPVEAWYAGVGYNYVSKFIFKLHTLLRLEIRFVYDRLAASD